MLYYEEEYHSPSTSTIEKLLKTQSKGGTLNDVEKNRVLRYAESQRKKNAAGKKKKKR